LGSYPLERGAGALAFESPRNASEAYSGCGQKFKGYAPDGPSGPTLDTANFMRGSLVHDTLYQLMREGLLNHNLPREAADRILQSLYREDGMLALRAWWVYPQPGYRQEDLLKSPRGQRQAPTYTGPQGGRYYINANGKRSYVQDL